ncbi:PKD-like family lipoprotein [uncultured Duncaniella sp.]|uniref:PKD-like family lipoprotein n=1 Tax=uncultured Duncaniella sp. TaxID=2768039 RepID=UPI00272C56CE|nr:PKD-like family lipoprotein [uncultured Duncaniella sp.]
MKKFLYIPVIVAAGLWSAGCADDIGNYDYTEINEVSVAVDDRSPEEGKTYNVVAFIDNIDFDPQIKSSLGINDESAYEYEWRVMPLGAGWEEIDTEDITVCTTRRINQPVTLSPGKYSAFFNVRDKATGVVWTTRFFLMVRSVTNEGWLVLSNVNDKCRLDIVYNRSETEDLLAHDIFQDVEMDLGKPERLIFNYDLRDQATLLVTDKNTYNLDQVDLHVGEENSLVWRFGVSPETVRVKASAISKYAGRNLWAIIDENDDLYTIARSVDGAFFEFPLTRLNGKIPFKPAPFIGVNHYNYNDGCNPVIMYDADHRQFIQIHNNSVYPSVMDFEGRHLFDNPTGRDMVHMESSKSGPVHSVLRDPSTGETYFYSIHLRGEYIEPENWWEEGDYISYNEQAAYGKVIGPDVDNATMFAFHHQWDYLFYAVGDKVYQFNLAAPDEPAIPVLSFPGETVKVLRFNPFVGWEAYVDWERARGYQLIVGTDVQGAPADNCGKVRFYEVPNLMQPLKKLKEYDGFGSIVEVVYKERAKS